MGMVTSAALSSLLTADSNLLVEIPDDWSMEDAATVPVVYSTVCYAFFVVGNSLNINYMILNASTSREAI